MPKSVWAGTSSSVNLVPVTTTIVNDSAQQNSPSYLTNQDKIDLMEKYNSELQVKTSLDNTATSLSLSHTTYDNAVAAISTVLVAAGAPANWTSTWPDGTTSGPWTNVQTSIANQWANVAAARTDLQAAISAQQAAGAQTAAIAAAATDASTKALGSAAMAASESIIPNGGFQSGDATGWADTEGGGWTYGTLPDGTKGITVAGGGSKAVASKAFQVIPGKRYKVIFYVYAGAGTQTVYLRAQYRADAAANVTNANRAGVFDFISAGSISTSATYYSFDWTPAAGQNFASLSVYEWNSSAAPIYVKSIFCVPYTQAAYLDAGAVTAASLVVANLDNLIPNPNSEQTAPAGGWPAGSWESVAINSGSAYEGSKCRLVATPSGGAISAIVTPNIPCASGDQYMFTAKAGGNSAGSVTSVGMEFLDSSGSWLAGYGSTQIAGTGWTTHTITTPVGGAPANAAFVHFILNTYGSAGTSSVFDQMYARRMVAGEVIVDGTITTVKLSATAIQTTNYAESGGSPTVGARMDISSTALKVAPGNLKLGTYTFADYLLPRIMQSLDGNATNGRVLYRGNCDVTTRGGAPNMACLGVTRRQWSSNVARFDLTLIPSQPSDNLDSMRFAKIDWYNQSAAGTTATMVGIGTQYLPITDRLYGNLSSDYNAANNSISTAQFISGGVSNVPAMLVTLYNAYGPSAGGCFYSDTSAADGVNLVNNGLSWPAGFTGASGGSSGGGSGSAGGGCPAPWVKITLASGLIVNASDLYDGAVVVGINDSTGQPSTGIVRKPHRIWVNRMAVVLDDGRAPEFSDNHRVLTDAGWVEVQRLEVGNTILGPTPGVVKALGATRKSEVIDFMVEGCHTYIADGLLSHNIKMD